MKRASLILATAIFSIFFAVFVNSQAYGGFEVSPSSYDFGDVDLGTSSTVIFTATNAMDESDCRACHGTSSADRHHNLGYVCGSCHGFPPERDCIVCHQALTIQNIQLQEGSSPDFLITEAPITPFDMYTGDSEYIEVTFSPLAEGYANAVLQIYGHSPYVWPKTIPLGGAGVMQESNLEEQVEAILAFMNQSVAEGTLAAVGKRKTASARWDSLHKLYNMIEVSGDLIADGYIEEACQQLQDAYRYTDGKSRPKDLVAGENAPTLAAMILDVVASMGCK